MDFAYYLFSIIYTIDLYILLVHFTYIVDFYILPVYQCTVALLNVLQYLMRIVVAV